MKKRSFKHYTAFAMALSVLVFSLSSCSLNSLKLNSSEDIASSSQTTEASRTSNSDSAEYESKLFDTSYVHNINIDIAESDWSDLKENPLEKTKYDVDITIDGEEFSNVAFSTKGNTSLSSIASDEDNDRYSFKVNFGKYVEGQTYYGLNKLNLNNIYADATYMKDYLSYEIFRQAGVDSPLVSYVWLTVNGEDHGLYIAIEDISESYLDRTQDGEGELYKPETEQLSNMDKVGGGDMKKPEMGEDTTMPEGFEPPEGAAPPDGENSEKRGKGGRPDMGGGFSGMPEDLTMPERMEMPSMPADGEMPDFSGGEMPDFAEGGMPGEFGSSSSGASLSYTDDEISSYSDIFDNSVTDADEESNQRVIAALKALSEGSDLESCIDTDEVIRYFAAHNFVLNYDSYTGNMLHNYYLYENDGKLSMLPWDYNLAFGGMGGGFGGGKEAGSKSEKSFDKDSFSDATSLVNTGIDTPLSGADADSRPMWSWISENEEYLEKYHEVYNELLTNYFESGEFEKQIDAIYEMILPYVEKETSAFYTADEFKTGYKTLKQFCLLRAESIRAQLDGELSADTSKQNDSDKISASDIKISDMGSMNRGGEGGKGGRPDFQFGKAGTDADSSATPSPSEPTEQ